MALTVEQENLIVKVGVICAKLLEMQTDMIQVNELWNGSPDWDTLITDENIQAMSSLAGVGLTKTKLADAIYQVELIRQQILTGNLPAVVLLAQLR